MPLPNSAIRNAMDVNGAYRRPGGVGTTYSTISPGEQWRSGTMGNILNNYFVPEYLRTQEQLPGAEQLLLERIKSPVDYAALRGEIESVAQGVQKDLFRAGGAVDLAGRQALGESVASGFGPTSGGYTAARQNILQGARDQITNAISQSAVQLAPVALDQHNSAISAAMGLNQYYASRADDLRESLFGGRASIENLDLAKRTMALNEAMINRALNRTAGSRIAGGAQGALAGAAAGSQIMPGVGTIAGGILGALGGIFG